LEKGKIKQEIDDLNAIRDLIEKVLGYYYIDKMRNDK